MSERETMLVEGKRLDEFGEYAANHLRIYGYEVVRFVREARPSGEPFSLTWDDGTVEWYQPLDDGDCPTCGSHVRRVVQITDPAAAAPALQQEGG